MHKLCEYIDKELEELEHKAGVGQKLSAGEIQYGDMLAHFKKCKGIERSIQRKSNIYETVFRNKSVWLSFVIARYL